MNDLTHLLVDLDGTLLGAHDLPLRIKFTGKALAMMRKHGTWLQSIQALRAMYSELEVPSKDLNNADRAVRVFSELMNIPADKANDVLNEAIASIFPKMEKFFFPVQGALEFLDWAKPRYNMILATNPVWAEEIVKMRMRWADIDPNWFSSITHAGRMHAIKPAPEYFLEILEQEKLTTADCLLIGNDPKKDLPATEVGIPVFILSDSSPLRTIRLKNGKAPAWRGTFQNLKELLSKSRAESNPPLEKVLRDLPTK